MNDISFLTATELGPLIKSRQLSPVELTKHILSRIDKIDPILYTRFLNFPSTSREAEDNIMRGEYKGPLHGIPIGIKDNYDKKRYTNDSWLKTFCSFRPNKNATIVKHC